MNAMQLLVLGLGYTGTAIARLAVDAGAPAFAHVVATSRTPERLRAPPGVRLIAWDDAEPALRTATHVLQTAAPTEHGDPALHRFGPALGNAYPNIVWAGMLSTTGVYGDRGGAWVDEDTFPAPTGPRGQRRLEAEQAWAAAFPNRPVDLFRVAGIYGPGRSVLDDVRAGQARRVDKPGHAFGRIHRDDIAQAVLAAMRQTARPPGVRVLNLADDEPRTNADVVAYAAELLGAPPPPIVPFEAALAAMSPMGRSFWAENRKVASAKTQQRLGITWRYPTFREGLAAVLEQEAGSPELPGPR